MRCPNCTERLEVQQVFVATPDAETRNLLCPRCGYRDVSISFLVGREQGRKQAYGSAAAALARKIAAGEIRPQLGD